MDPSSRLNMTEQRALEEDLARQRVQALHSAKPGPPAKRGGAQHLGS
jgi:hypothetical protein